MAKLTITIDTDNAAFDDQPGAEVARILRELAGRMEDITSAYLLGIAQLPLRDINGNTVGKCLGRPRP